MKNLQYKSFQAQLSPDENYVEGYASAYDNIDSHGDVIVKGAFTKTLDSANRKAPVRFLWQHDHARPIGTIVKWEDRPEGLWFKARFSDTTDGRDARENFKSGAMDRFSIGFVPVIQKAERQGNKRINYIKEIALWEVSAVTFPSNELAMMTAIKSAISGELSEENRALIVRIAESLLAAQGAAVAEEPVDAVEGDPEADVEPEPDAADAPAEEDAEGEESAADDAVDAEEAKPAASSEDEDEEDKKVKKSLSDAIDAFRLELALKRALSR